MLVMKSRNRMLKCLAAALCLALVTVAGALALDGSIHGSLKTFFMGVHDPFFQSDLYGLSDTTLRLQARVYPTDTLLIETDYSISPQVFSGKLQSAGISESFLSTGGGSGGYRAFDFDEMLFPLKSAEAENLAVYHNLDRAFVSIYLPFGDVYAGRQAISWGSAHVINPTDIIAPYSVSNLNTKEKRGVDALRLRMPVGAMGEIDIGYVAGDEFKLNESAVFARTRFYAAGTDIALLAMDFQENLLIGGDATRSIGGAGSWIEAAYVVPDAFSGNDPAAEQQYVKVSAGMDYNFGPKFYGYAEYHYNSAGKSDTAKYADIELRPEEHLAYTEGSVYLRGQHYGALGGTYQLSPLLPVNGIVLLNLNDFSAHVSLDFDYNFTENVYISGGGIFGLGASPELDEGGSPVSYKSEFGAAPHLYYVAVKLYF